MAPSDRRKAEASGRWAEAVAAWFLRLKGYGILSRRAKTPVGEIDLVVARGQTVAFIEVKRRLGRDQGLFAVTPRQASRIVRGARYWIAAHPAHAGRDCRFDIIIVSPYQMPLHLVDVFQDDGGQQMQRTPRR